MMNNPYSAQAPAPAEFRANPATVQAIHKHREDALDFIRKAHNRHVRVQLANGQVIEGVIVSADPDHLYIRVSQGQGYGHHRAFFGPFSPFSPFGPFGPGNPAAYYNDVVLPLVLYNLLVITLLS